MGSDSACGTNSKGDAMNVNRQSDVTTVTTNTRELLQGVLSATDHLVEDALQGRWTKVLDGVEQRRRVMQYLVENVPELTDTSLPDADAAEEDDEDVQVDLLRAAAADVGRKGASGE